jgi:hypothetical protein
MREKFGIARCWVVERQQSFASGNCSFWSKRHKPWSEKVWRGWCRPAFAMVADASSIPR